MRVLAPDSSPSLVSPPRCPSWGVTSRGLPGPCNSPPLVCSQHPPKAGQEQPQLRSKQDYWTELISFIEQTTGRAGSDDLSLLTLPPVLNY